MKKMIMLWSAVIMLFVTGFVMAKERLLPSSTSVKALKSSIMRFEPNLGQTDTAVQFLARQEGCILFLMPEEAVFKSAEGRTFRMKFEGAAKDAEARTGAPLPGTSNYYKGKDPEHWVTKVPAYESILYSNMYTTSSLPPEPSRKPSASFSTGWTGWKSTGPGASSSTSARRF
jgi:hypothetical protein